MYRGTFAIIDETAIRDNIAAIRAHIPPHVRMMLAVKADGYGHGMLESAKAALAGGADYFGVATIEEALKLRLDFPETPILVLGSVSPIAAQSAAKHQIDVTITDDWSQFSTVPRFSPPLRIHLKVDTGMTRLGFRSVEAFIKAADWFERRDDIHIAGVFSHLACADEPELGHARGQVSRFEANLSPLRQKGFGVAGADQLDSNDGPVLLHIANSAAALRVPEWHYDMVRIGISAYGFPPSDGFTLPVRLRQAMNVYSFITRVVEVDVGSTVGYGATYTASRTSRIATVPIGYGDGYPRHLSNRGYVLVGHQRAPVVGNVCMDQLMIDVTDISDIQVGDCVTIYGRPAPKEWSWSRIEMFSENEQAEYLINGFRKLDASSSDTASIHELAQLAGTISYELVCALSYRVPHLYTGL